MRPLRQLACVLAVCGVLLVPRLTYAAGCCVCNGALCVPNPQCTDSVATIDACSTLCSAQDVSCVAVSYVTGDTCAAGCGDAFDTPTPTATLTHTPTFTPTETPTDTPTRTPTDTPTETPTNTPTRTPTDTPTVTPTNTPTDTPTATPTFTVTNTPTNTPTATNTPTSTPTNTPTNTSITPSATPTRTPTATKTSVPTKTPVNTLTPTVTNTPTNTPTNTITNTPANTATQTSTPLPTSVCQSHPGLLPVNENVWVTNQNGAGTVAFALPPVPAANVIRLGDVTLSANCATIFTLTVGGYVENLYIAAADTVVLPRQICGTGGPGTIASSGSCAWSATIPWNYDIPHLYP